MLTRFLAVTGSCPGAGKSTLARDLVAELQGRGEQVLLVDEDAVWGERRVDDAPVDYGTAWPEFRRLLHGKRGVPTPEDLLRTFDLIEARCAVGGVWLQDWCWLDLASSLPWASDDDVLAAFAVRLRQRASSLRLAALHLVVDPQVGLERAVAERGPVWLARHTGVTGSVSLDESLQLVRARSEARAERMASVLSAAGWSRVEVNGEKARAEVCRMALAVLDGGVWAPSG